MPGDEQILDDDDVVYRRIPYNMFDSSIDAVPSPQSFQPHRENDTDGISLWCANSKTPEEAASGLSRKPYHVVEVRVGDIRARGLSVVVDSDDGHAVIPELNSGNRKSDQTGEHCVALAHELSRVVIDRSGEYVDE